MLKLDNLQINTNKKINQVFFTLHAVANKPSENSIFQLVYAMPVIARTKTSIETTKNKTNYQL
jgi:hypothetical protein